MSELPTIPNCTIDGVVSTNALATVYRARRGDESVAVKVYRSSKVSPAAEQRIQREISAQRGVDHPCVARLLDAGSLSTGEPYLISAWIEGPTLEEHLAHGPLGAAQTVAVTRALAAGLVAIHACGILHRDLKPQNVVVPGSDGLAAAVIIDFGHSLLIDEQRLTDTGVILGSVCYMAPEYASGGTIDARADLYALGVIVYRCLTGALPFDGSSDAEVLLRHQHELIVPPRTIDASIPQALEDLCMWLLAKDPAARVPNAHVLDYALRAMRSDQTRSAGQGAEYFA